MGDINQTEIAGVHIEVEESEALVLREPARRVQIDEDEWADHPEQVIVFHDEKSIIALRDFLNAHLGEVVCQGTCPPKSAT